jgi:hypothetical protein
MRENTLLSPHRARRKGEDSHDRQIITAAPNIMWAIDATQIPTVQHGKVWLFGVSEHWNAEMLGWHVSKRGTRFEAIQALSMAVRQQFRHLSADAARGLALRHDHGSNFMADHFQKQVRLRWSPAVGQFDGLDKLGPGCPQAANLVMSPAPYASSGVRPPSPLWGRLAL